MGLRPVPARWFEVLVPIDDLASAVEAIAATGAVEIEACDELPSESVAAELRPLLETFDQLARRYGPYFPSPTPDAPLRGFPEDTLRRALGVVVTWAQGADPMIAELERLGHEREGLELARELLGRGDEAIPDPFLLAGAGPTLAAMVWTTTEEVSWPSASAPVQSFVVHRDGRDFFVAVGPGAALADLERELEGMKARRVPLEHTLRAGSAIPGVEERLRAVETRLYAVRGQIVALSEELALARELGRFERLRWYVTSVPRPGRTRHFGVITGWTVDATGERLRAALEGAGLIGWVDLLPDPPGRRPPVFLTNPRWARPFQALAELFGMPDRDEIDPSVLLGLLFPLLFGYMFGDVGQGAVLVLLGVLLWRRHPALRLLVPGGLAAVAFGLLFGSVFAREDLIPALWLHPAGEPLTVLGASVVAGGAILSVGLLLDGLTAYYRGRLLDWARADIALAVVYAGLWLCLIHPVGPALAVAGVVWNALGGALGASRRRLSAALTATGHLVERGLQLLINTVSFARVGAFALAHAGLSSAIIALTEAVEGMGAKIVVLVIGNAFTIGLEGLIVGIQTSRLMLFEFFVRFFRGEGRAFRALSPPPSRRDAEVEP